MATSLQPPPPMLNFAEFGAPAFNTHVSQNMMRNSHGYFGYFIRNPSNISESGLSVICVMCQDHIPKKLKKNITNLLCTIFDISFEATILVINNQHKQYNLMNSETINK